MSAWTRVTPHGTLTFQSFPKCPQCGADWPDDNRHIDGGHCPGRPEGCTCRHDLRVHREPLGCWTREDGRCTCPYGRRPVDWSHGGVFHRDEDA